MAMNFVTAECHLRSERNTLPLASRTAITSHTKRLSLRGGAPSMEFQGINPLHD